MRPANLFNDLGHQIASDSTLHAPSPSSPPLTPASDPSQHRHLNTPNNRRSCSPPSAITLSTSCALPALRCSTSIHPTMYHSPGIRRSSTEEDGRLRRDSRASTTAQHIPSYTAPSPTQAHFHNYSPPNGNHQSSTYNTYSSRPSSSAAMQMPPSINQSPRLGPPPSPTNGLSHLNRSAYAAREPGTSTFYDPTSEHREAQVTWTQSPYPGPSPVQVS